MRQKGPAEYHRIGETARALDLNTSVLRFWEEEFPQLRPKRTPKGQRLYSDKDMAALARIKSLLHEQGMTIEGARRVLAGQMDAPAESAPPSAPVSLSFPSPLSSSSPEEGGIAPSSPPRHEACGSGAPHPHSPPAAAFRSDPRHAGLLRQIARELEELRNLLRDGASSSPESSSSGSPAAEERLSS